MSFIDSLLDTIDKRKGLWSEPKKSGSVVRSNKAHQRLEEKALREKNYRLMRYHNRVYYEQCEQNRVLSRSERGKFFMK